MIPVWQEEFQALACRYQKPRRSTRSKALSRRECEIKKMRELKLPRREIAMAALLSRSKLSMGWKITEEGRLCIEFADRMREHSKEGRYRGIWGHIANEGKRHQIVAAIMVAMGMLPGSPDYFFMGPWGSGVIEFKSPGEKLTLTQECYHDWCAADGVRRAIVYSPDQAEEVLKSWGAL